MYPETDIPPMPIPSEMVERIRRLIPRPWEEQIKEYMVHYGLSKKLAFQIYDSDFSDLFKKLASTTKVPPSFIAATLTETLVSLSRMGLDTSNLEEETLEDLFTAIDQGALSKEAVPLVLEKILRGDVKDVDEAVKRFGLQMMTDDELRRVVCKVVNENRQEVYIKGEQSFSLLMGRVMAVVRADGRKVSIILKEEINKLIKEGKKRLENPV